MRRDRLEICRDILRACRKGERKSQIILKTRTSGEQIRQLMPFLVEQGFIELIYKNEREKIYKLTPKGLTLLIALENVYIILNKENNSKPPIFMIGCGKTLSFYISSYSILGF